MSSAPRIRSRGSEPLNQSRQPERRTLPMTIWVTLLPRAQARISSAIRSPGRTRVSPPSRSARRSVSATRSLAASPARRSAAVWTWIAVQGALQPVGQPLGVADQLGRTLAAMDAGQQPLARGPGAGEAVRAHVLDHLVVDALGRAAQRQLAQGGEVAVAEIVVERPAGGLGHVDLALVQPRRAARPA